MKMHAAATALILVHRGFGTFNCPSCDLVPCGECQEGCSISFDGCSNISSATSRNGCPAGNRGEHPTGCSKPDPDAPHQPITPGSSFCGAPGWQQVWADEFNSNTLDDSSWTTDLVSRGKCALTDLHAPLNPICEPLAFLLLEP
eukprot:SAG31_NODE_4465_length_3209_cov_4.435691_2_plen_144_part_00